MDGDGKAVERRAAETAKETRAHDRRERRKEVGVTDQNSTLEAAGDSCGQERRALPRAPETREAWHRPPGDG